ncbi:MAG: ribonuclease catalytic domain-containing protein [Candidatus Sericytochromatia bacterium]
MVQSGQLLEFLNKNQVMVGVCQQINANHVRVLTEQNKEMNLVERKILHVLDRHLSGNSSRLEKVEAMKEWAARCLKSGPEVDLRTLWEVLEGETEVQSIRDLAQMYFSEAGDSERSALLRALVEDRIFFDRRSDEGFVPRTADKVQLIIEQQAREAKKLLSRTATVAWIRSNLATGEPQPPPPEAEGFLPALQEVAIRQQQSNQYQAVAQLLQEAGVSGRSEELSLQLLIRSGFWDEDINLQLLEYDVPRNFSREVLNMVDSLELNLSQALKQRQDLRPLHTITIDDAETTDIDDALSWEARTEGGIRLWIHIADPAEFVSRESALDSEAARRFTSIYLCEGKIEMLPAKLAQDLCSLVQDQPRLALSVEVELDAQAQVQSYAIRESLILVGRRMSYEDVDNELDQDPRLQQLYEIAHQLREQRLARGAVEIVRPELRIKVTADKQILLKRVERDSPAQRLVSELMILANHLVARRLGEARIPLIYKVQDAPSETMADGRPLLKRAEMSTRSGLHYGLGLTAYTQFTSPIRRYNDLVLHRQIKSWLRTGTGLYSEDELVYMIALSDRALNSANIIQRENFRYWLLKYFSQLPTPRLVAATVNSIGEEKGWLNLVDYCYDVPMAAADLGGLKEGDSLWLSIEQAQPRRGRLVIRRSQAPVSSEQLTGNS